MTLTADEIHVLLDAIDGTQNPWDRYTTHSNDPRATPEGWRHLLAMARAKLDAELEGKPPPNSAWCTEHNGLFRCAKGSICEREKMCSPCSIRIYHEKKGETQT